MAIYKISTPENMTARSGALEELCQVEEPEHIALPPVDPEVSSERLRDRLISTCGARLFFLLLLACDLLWMGYSVMRLSVSILLALVTGLKVEFFKKGCKGAFLSLQRSMICGVSLIISLFSPAFGIMIACTYFLMYDKTGIDEVVPASLQAQFKGFMPGSCP